MEKSLPQKHIIKNIVQMIAAELQQIKRLWRNTMKKKQLDLDKKDYASHAAQV
jgi:hypothetical protein